MKNKLFWARLICYIAVVLIIFSAAITFLNRTLNSSQLSAIKTGIERSVIQCYALEGFYPPNIEYLYQNYGLSDGGTK